MKKTLATLALAGTLFFDGCFKEPKQETLEGTVKEEFGEFGEAKKIVPSSGALFGNESVRFGKPEYGLVLESKGKIYTIQVYERSGKPLMPLAKAIEPGDRIKITYHEYATIIGEDGIGQTPSNTISIIEKSKK